MVGAWLEGRLFTAVNCNNRELKQRRRRRQRERQKAVALDWQNKNFAHASRSLYISLPSLLDYDVKLPNFTFYGGRGHKQRFFFLLWTLVQFIGIQLLKKSQKFDKLKELEYERRSLKQREFTFAWRFRCRCGLITSTQNRFYSSAENVVFGINFVCT